MAWIYNKETKVLTECHNKDVVKICEKDTIGYIVSEEKSKIIEACKESKSQKTSNEEKPLDKLSIEELKSLAEEKGIEGFDSLTKPELLKVLKEA